MTTTIGIIGGTGLTSLDTLKINRREIVMTPYGEPSSPIIFGKLEEQTDTEVAFLARHGHAHNIPPHMVNYRANIWALNSIGADAIIAINAVGAMRKDLVPGSLVVPDQIIDYTSMRSNTFFEKNLSHVTHIDFSYPYTESLRQLFSESAQNVRLNLIMGATYGVTEGPRLETASEIKRMIRDGCDIVGMTAMPEAALSRELEIKYASICVNANWAAGISDELITMSAIEHHIESAMSDIRQLLPEIIRHYPVK